MTTLDEFYQKDIAFDGDFLRTATGDIDTISGLKNLKQAIFHRIITVPGSLVFRPDYGVGLKSYLNSPLSIALQTELALRIQEQLRLDPRIEDVEGVSFRSNPREPELTVLVVRVKPRGYDETSFEFLPFGEGQ